MKAEKRLTKKVCDTAIYQGENGNFFAIWDTELPSFGLRINPNGTKTFIVSYRLKGKKRMMSLGRYGILTVDGARKAAREKLVEVSKGTDPLETKKKSRLGETMTDLAVLYMENHAKVKKRTWKIDQGRLNKYVLPAFGKRKAVNINRADISNLHLMIGKDHFFEANRVRALLSVMFEFGIKSGFLPETFTNPCRYIEKFPESKRERWLSTDDELVRFLHAVDEEDDIYVRSAIWVLLLTGCRKNEILRAKWSNVNFDTKQLFLDRGETKSGKSEYKELSDEAISILRSIPRVVGNPYVFPSPRREGQPMKDIRNPWKRILERAGIENCRTHDLRRTFLSLMVNLDVPIFVASKAAGHSSVRITEEVYTKLKNEPIRDAVGKVSGKIVDIVALKRKGDEKVS